MLNVLKKTIFALFLIANSNWAVSFAQPSKELVIDSMESVHFTYTHIVDGNVDDSQVNQHILMAAAEFKLLFQKLFEIFKEAKHSAPLTIRICSDLIACFPSQYEPTTNSIYIKTIDDINKPSELTAEMAVAVHEYTHRVFHSLMNKKINNFSDQWLAYENEGLSDQDRARFSDFLNLSYLPITELMADFSSSIFFSDPNIMQVRYGQLRGFQIDYSQQDENFYNASTFGSGGALVPDPYRILVPLRKTLWNLCVKTRRIATISEKASIMSEIITQAISLNKKLYMKAMGSGLTKGDLLEGVRNLCQ